MKSNYYPNNTAVAVRLESLIKSEGKKLLSERMSSRMVKCASVMNEESFVGWQIEIPTKGLAILSLFGSEEFTEKELRWCAEKTGKTVKGVLKTSVSSLTQLYEVYLPITETGQTRAIIGFNCGTPTTKDDSISKWPTHYSEIFAELVSVLRDTGAVMRVVLGPATDEEQTFCRKNTLHSYDVDGISVRDYLGRPVKMRVLLLLPTSPSIRLKTVLEEAVQGAKCRYVGDIETQKAEEIWRNPLFEAQVLPDYAARILMMEPEIHETTIGLQVCEEPVKKIPASHRNTKSHGAVEIGKAVDTAGICRRITIGETDIKRHYQIVGQTGTGKSTLLTKLILSAIEKGHGLTFFDPHGSTIDLLLRMIPKQYAERVRVVRIGDAEHPVPLNIWDSDDPSKEERNISDLCELFGDIFNPPGECFVGPRWERWFSTFAKASIAFLGRRASLESIAVISQSQDNMLKVSKAIANRYPELVETIKQEYGTDKSNDFQATLNWYLCKFQRLISVEQLRKTLGAGANALDFTNSIDTDTVTLIDLASPNIGTHAARIVGTLLLMKLWNAAMARHERDKTHFVVVDEAALFQTNPMPRMLAESRKFGLAMVLCHQHTGQLTAEIRDALEANSANFSAFRLSPRDALTAAVRFDDPNMKVNLARLDAFNAITTLSVDGRQTAPFTLTIDKPKMQKDGEAVAAYIEQSSIERLVKPYMDVRALTSSEILNLLNNPQKIMEERSHLVIPAFLEEWSVRRQELKKAI